MRRNLMEIEKYVSASTYIFPTWFVLTIVINLIQTPQAISMVIYPLTVNTQWNKCHSLLWLALIKLDIQKLAMDMSVFSSQKLVLTKKIPLNSASVSMEYNSRFNSSLGGQGRLLQILWNKLTNMICFCSEKQGLDIHKILTWVDKHTSVPDKWR